jgi:lipopolysaccharide export system permease protein
MRIVRTLDRYVTTEFIQYFLLGVFIFIIFVMGNTVLFTYMDPALEKKVPSGIMLRVILYQVPSFAVMAMPLATLFAALLSVGRLSRDSEIDVMRTSGISVLRILLPYMVMGLLITGTGYFMLQRVVPVANKRSMDMWRRFFYSEVGKEPVVNVFFQAKNGKTFYVRQMDPRTRTMQGIFIIDTKPGENFPREITAPTGVWTDEFAVLQNGLIHHFNQRGMLDYEARFGSLRIDLQRQIREFIGDNRTTQEMSLGELKQRISIYRKSGIDTRADETDYYFKMAIPVGSFICVLLGVPLSIRTGRSGLMQNITIVVLLVAFYQVLTIADTLLGRRGVLPPMVAAWGQNALFLAIGVVLVLRTRK